jgi:hypothetical protein
MKTIKNISINLNKELLNFYEWESNDKIKIISKINVYKINNKDYYNLLKKDIRLLGGSINEKLAIFCNDFDALCVEFDNNKNSIKRSKLQLDEEYSVLQIMQREKCIKLKYSNINDVKYSYYSRNETQRINYIKSFISNNKEDKCIIKYLNYEYFNIKSSDVNYLYNNINNASVDKINDFYEAIKSISV